jgi:hypothetical protein
MALSSAGPIAQAHLKKPAVELIMSARAWPQQSAFSDCRHRLGADFVALIKGTCPVAGGEPRQPCHLRGDLLRLGTARQCLRGPRSVPS